jgi:hypothetical protein
VPNTTGFQPAVSQCFQPVDDSMNPAQRAWQRSADWKSAIRQVGNLRYARPARLCQWASERTTRMAQVHSVRFVAAAASWDKIKS